MMRKKKVYANIGDEVNLEIIFVPDEFTADAGGAKEARHEGLQVPGKTLFVGGNFISVAPIEQVLRFGQRPAAPQADEWIPCSKITIEHGDERGDVWGLSDYGEISLESAESLERGWHGHITHFQPTGLKRPQPPQED